MSTLARTPLRLQAPVRRPGLVPAAIVLAIVIGWALVPGLFTSADPIAGDPAAALQPPSAGHWFGTDMTGRDVFSRVVHGSVHSLTGALVAVLVGVALGLTIGVIAGSAGGFVEDALMRVVDVLLSIPSLLLALSIIILLGVITLAMEDPVRVAEDTAVLDVLAGGRLEIGLGSGGTPSSFTAFGETFDARYSTFADHLATLLDAWQGKDLGGPENRLYPAGGTLPERLWQATFSVAGGERAGLRGDGLMLSRTQPRAADAPAATLSELQDPIIDAYLAALPSTSRPRILASRTLFVADDREEALHHADIGLRRAAATMKYLDPRLQHAPLADLIEALDTHVGTPEDVVASLAADTALARSTDVAFQVHSVDPPHQLTSSTS